MALDLGTCLRYYKRKDIQETMIEHARNKEVGTRYHDSFGKRPDILMYPKDIIELVLRGVTSFHASEELWDNPLSLGNNLSPKELSELRTGWDLVLDIDCKDWEFSKLITHLFIKALKENGARNISCKFSGNKGFHIGVPFEDFPESVGKEKTSDLFPKAPQKIAQYLLDFISKNFIEIENNQIIFDKKFSFSIDKIKEKFGDKRFVINHCSNCRKEISLERKDGETEFICPKCDLKTKNDSDFLKCDKCQVLMTKIEAKSSLCQCRSNKYFSKFNPLSIIEVDTILIAPRHLYRMPYSLHEKSGLASLPIDPETVIDFDKSLAVPDGLKVSELKFLDRNVAEKSAGRLLIQALDFEAQDQEYQLKKKDLLGEKKKSGRDEIQITSPITEDLFPPCIKLMLDGLEDGKKRAVFCLSNYLGKIGWNKEDIEAYLLKWNHEKNKLKDLRDNYIIGQLRYFKVGERLPPNCNNEAYYKDIGVCKPDEWCQRIKNPANYTLLKWKNVLRNKEEEEGKGKRGRKKKEKVRAEIKAETEEKKETVEKKSEEKIEIEDQKLS